MVSALAVLIRNRVRPTGLSRLKFPCHLTGSGMAIPFELFKEAPNTKGNLVEDLVLGSSSRSRVMRPFGARTPKSAAPCLRANTPQKANAPAGNTGIWTPWSAKAHG